MSPFNKHASDSNNSNPFNIRDEIIRMKCILHRYGSCTAINTNNEEKKRNEKINKYNNKIIQDMINKKKKKQ